MSLSDKLEEARRKRMTAAGLVPPRALLPEPTMAPPSAPRLFEPIVIEVRPVPGQLVSTAPAVDLTEMASDAMCPNCHRQGRLDLVDLVGQTRHCSCDFCGAMWQLREDAKADTA